MRACGRNWKDLGPVGVQGRAGSGWEDFEVHRMMLGAVQALGVWEKVWGLLEAAAQEVG